MINTFLFIYQYLPLYIVRSIGFVHEPRSSGRIYDLGIGLFVRELSKADHLVLAEIYAARERNTVGISSKDLQAQIPGSVYCKTLPEVTEYLRSIAKPGDVILTVGAGDIFRAGEALLQ